MLESGYYQTYTSQLARGQKSPSLTHDTASLGKSIENQIFNDRGQN